MTLALPHLSLFDHDESPVPATDTFTESTEIYCGLEHAKSGHVFVSILVLYF